MTVILDLSTGKEVTIEEAKAQFAANASMRDLVGMSKGDVIEELQEARAELARADALTATLVQTIDEGLEEREALMRLLAAYEQCREHSHAHAATG